MSTELESTLAVGTPRVDAVQNTLRTIRKELSQSMVERDEEIYMAMVAMLAGEHCLLVGPPGTGKSYLCDRLTACIDGANAFHRLLTKFSTPEEVFGPIKLSGLKHDVYERAVDGYLPTAHLGFVDEVFKASSAIINTLLNLMQERKYNNGTARLDCPLMLLIGASNEWPVGEGRAELGAAFDRFLLRKQVKYCSPGGVERLLFGAPLTDPTTKISLADLEFAQSITSSLPFTTDAQNAFMEIKHKLHAEGIDPGDRRLFKSRFACQAAAFLEGGSSVEPENLEILQHILWDDPGEQVAKCQEVVGKIANPVGQEVHNLMVAAAEITSKINPTDAASPETFAGFKKLGEIIKQLEKLPGGGQRAKNVAESLKEDVAKIQRKLMGIPDTMPVPPLK